ncbi:hypothetical protein BH24ACT8_BH24ACT8_05810 [soil metagenome]
MGESLSRSKQTVERSSGPSRGVGTTPEHRLAQFFGVHCASGENVGLCLFNVLDGCGVREGVDMVSVG